MTVVITNHRHLYVVLDSVNRGLGECNLFVSLLAELLVNLVIPIVIMNQYSYPYVELDAAVR